MGIYCINAARYLFQDEPGEVIATSANNGEKRFAQVDEMTSVILRFPRERLATFTCSFGVSKVSTFQIVGTKGDLRMNSSYSFTGELTQQITVNGVTREKSCAAGDQFGAEILYFSDCILKQRSLEPSGQEGLADVRIIRAIHESARTGQLIQLEEFHRTQRPTPEQVIQLPALEKLPELIHATDPSGH